MHLIAGIINGVCCFIILITQAISLMSYLSISIIITHSITTYISSSTHSILSLSMIHIDPNSTLFISLSISKHPTAIEVYSYVLKYNCSAI
jgi:hypothetical protein